MITAAGIHQWAATQSIQDPDSSGGTTAGFFCTTGAGVGTGGEVLSTGGGTGVAVGAEGVDAGAVGAGEGAAVTDGAGFV